MKRQKKRFPLATVAAAESFILECRFHGLAWKLIPKLLGEVMKDWRHLGQSPSEEQDSAQPKSGWIWR